MYIILFNLSRTSYLLSYVEKGSPVLHVMALGQVTFVPQSKKRLGHTVLYYIHIFVYALIITAMIDEMVK